MGTRSSLLAAIALLLTTPALAALPPAQQRSRELRAVIVGATPRLQDPIEAVERVSDDLYRLRAGACTLEARIVDARPAVRAVPSGRRFRVNLSEPICR